MLGPAEAKPLSVRPKPRPGPKPIKQETAEGSNREARRQAPTGRARPRASACAQDGPPRRPVACAQDGPPRLLRPGAAEQACAHLLHDHDVHASKMACDDITHPSLTPPSPISSSSPPSRLSGPRLELRAADAAPENNGAHAHTEDGACRRPTSLSPTQFAGLTSLWYVAISLSSPAHARTHTHMSSIART